MSVHHYLSCIMRPSSCDRIIVFFVSFLPRTKQLNKYSYSVKFMQNRFQFPHFHMT